MLKAVILTPQHKESNPRNNPLSTSRFLQVPHHIDIYMKPIKLQAISERKKKKTKHKNHNCMETLMQITDIIPIIILT